MSLCCPHLTVPDGPDGQQPDQCGTPGGLTATTPFGFAGGYTDPTDLIYLIHRYYDPSTGQFISAT